MSPEPSRTTPPARTDTHAPATRNERLVLSEHPCFSRAAHGRTGRIHLPVAPECNIQCGYCVRKFDCVNESRPGVSSTVLSASEAIERVRAVVERNGNIGAVGIAGPGDPLANEATFETLSLLRDEYPELIGCVSTNGLELPARIGDLVDVGVRSLTVTINAVMPETAAAVYAWVSGPTGERLRGIEAGEHLLARQWAGLRAAVAAGLVVKVNSVYLPGVNDFELPAIAQVAGAAGAHMSNILPLIPQARFANAIPPTPAQIHAMRASCEEHISQMSHCQQCRADACGLIGKDQDMESETLMARFADEYLEMVV
ncbi:MAG: radical SAM protein [Coriobacteriia bacterium]|nr:radical SAM protein [Coriobacteriia bacterium]